MLSDLTFLPSGQFQSHALVLRLEKLAGHHLQAHKNNWVHILFSIRHITYNQVLGQHEFRFVHVMGVYDLWVLGRDVFLYKYV